MNTRVILTEVDYEIYNLTISGVLLGQYERSEIRHIIGQLDSGINVGKISANQISSADYAPKAEIKSSVNYSPISPEEMAALISQVKAGSPDDDCLMCGS
jgi:hypothetical protein